MEPPCRALRFDRGLGVLMLTAAALMLAGLGAPDLWTHEGRWAAICRAMMRTGDYLHPVLLGDDYFDKPLLSYWLMIGAARLLGQLDLWALRLPSVAAGLTAVYATYRMGARLYDRDTGLRAGWMLAAAPVFIFWSRQACADMLNLATVALAAAWYLERRDRPGAVTSIVFFLILGIGAQAKGLVAVVVAMIVVLADAIPSGRWKAQLRPSCWPGPILGAAVYLLPFWAAARHAPPGYQADGLAMVVRENIVRYFQPFDHALPWYTYLLYLPLLALPWTPLLPLAWKERSRESRGMLLAGALVFLFFTAGAGRRPYYLLPILPFLILPLAERLRPHYPPVWLPGVSRALIAGSVAGMLLVFGVALPWAARFGGKEVMAAEIRSQTDRRAPWSDWDLVLVGTKPQMDYYLEPLRELHRLGDASALDLQLRGRARVVIVTRLRLLSDLEAKYPGAAKVVERSRLPWSLGQVRTDEDAQVALLVETAAP